MKPFKVSRNRPFLHLMKMKLQQVQGLEEQVPGQNHPAHLKWREPIRTEPVTAATEVTKLSVTAKNKQVEEKKLHK